MIPGDTPLSRRRQARAFIPGLDLADVFYHESVASILESRVTSLAHTAALTGTGSEVLCFDTEMSTLKPVTARM